MATTVTHDPVNHPHLLKLTGDVVNANGSLNRGEVRSGIFSSSNPVGDLTGKVDFIICFNRSGGSPGWAHEDHSAAFNPRPLRGIVEIHRIDLNADSQLDHMSGLFSLLLQEMGHYWIRANAGQAQIRTGSGMVDTPTAQQMIDVLNNGGDYPPYPIIGRQDSHWSPFLDGENSPFEAGKFGAETETDGIGWFGSGQRFTQVEGQAKLGPEFHLPGADGGTVTTTAVYSVLERWLMGHFIPPKLAALGTVWPTFRAIESRWAFPLPFQAGLFVELHTGERLYTGFDQGPHQLRVMQTDGAYTGEALTLPSDPYRPHDVVGFRVVQVGNAIRLQARVWPVRSGCLLGWLYRFKANPSCGAILDDLRENLADPGMGAPDHYFGWRTIGTRTGTVRKVGLSSRSLQTGGSGANRQYGSVYTRLNARLCMLTEGAIQEVSTLDLAEDIPQPGPRRLGDGRLMMPYNAGSFPEDDAAQRAPKWVTDAPNGDFAFGGRVSLEMCTFVSWAGGLAPGRKLVGHLRRVKLNDFVLPFDAMRPRRTEEPHEGAYKVLFCTASRTDAEVPALDLSRLDRIRRAFEIDYSLVTSRRINTQIA